MEIRSMCSERERKKLCSELFPLCTLCARVADPGGIDPDPTLEIVPDPTFKQTGFASGLQNTGSGSDLRNTMLVLFLKVKSKCKRILYDCDISTLSQLWSIKTIKYFRF